MGLFISQLSVEGTRRARSSTADSASNNNSTSSGRVLSNVPPVFKSKAGGSSSSISVKIAYATMKRNGHKCEFRKLHQAFFRVGESTANVCYLTEAVKEKWGKDLVLVTADGILIEDSSGTRGVPVIDR